MWCNRCQQDVPGVASQSGGEPCCPRCRSSLNNNGSQVTEADFWQLENWDFEEDLDSADQLVRQYRQTTDQPASPVIRIDPPHVTIQSKPEAPSTSKPSGGAGWAVIALGLTTAVCGAGLLGWSYLGQRPDLVPVGAPFLAGGQAVLILGLLIQLDNLWRNTREVSESLRTLDGQIDELRTRLPAEGSVSSHAFYSHLATGASPQVLLADLKGQLDLLANRIGE